MSLASVSLTVMSLAVMVSAVAFSSSSGAGNEGSYPSRLEGALKKNIVRHNLSEGLVEDIMKHLKKIFHTAGVEREYPYMKPSCYSEQNHTPP